MSLVEQELFILPEHLSSPLGFMLLDLLIFHVMFCRSLFVLFLLAIVHVLSVLRFMASDYKFRIFKLFLKISCWLTGSMLAFSYFVEVCIVLSIIGDVLFMLYVLRFIGDVLFMLYCFTFYWWRFVYVVLFYVLLVTFCLY